MSERTWSPTVVVDNVAHPVRTHPPIGVLLHGTPTTFTPVLVAALSRGSMLVHVDGSRVTSTTTRAVLQITLPGERARDRRGFRRDLRAQLHDLIRRMPDNARILIVAERSGTAPMARIPRYGLQAAMIAARAAAAQERGSSVMINTLVLSATDGMEWVAGRVAAEIRRRSFPDTGCVVMDSDLGNRSITSAIAEQCS
ncbi:MAG: hypothetical protein JWQ43_2101 [Glaciihabitans sp.]|nr:hypothetical protein [Glaciihabitans sp.]